MLHCYLFEERFSLYLTLWFMGLDSKHYFMIAVLMECPVSTISKQFLLVFFSYYLFCGQARKAQISQH